MRSSPRGAASVDGQRTPAAVVFDLDGTLVDSRGDIAAAANHALVRHGLRPLGVDEIARFVGDGARRLMSRASGLNHDTAELDPLVDVFVTYYTEHPAELTRLLPGVPEALLQLEGLPLAVCTNKPRPAAEAVLEELGLAGFFTALVAGGDLPKLKPDPLPLLVIAERLGLAPRHLVMVGDGLQDILSGRHAGAFAVALDGPMLADVALDETPPDALIRSLFELPGLLSAWGWRGAQAVNV